MYNWAFYNTGAQVMLKIWQPSGMIFSKLTLLMSPLFVNLCISYGFFKSILDLAWQQSKLTLFTFNHHGFYKYFVSFTFYCWSVACSILSYSSIALLYNH